VIVNVSGRRYMYPASHLYATLLLCRLLIVSELNSFVICCLSGSCHCRCSNRFGRTYCRGSTR